MLPSNSFFRERVPLAYKGAAFLFAGNVPSLPKWKSMLDRKTSEINSISIDIIKTHIRSSPGTLYRLFDNFHSHFKQLLIFCRNVFHGKG